MSYRCALYARVSTSDQDCSSQLLEVRQYVASRNGWEIVRGFVDAGISGAKASRPALDALMKDAAKRKFNAVLVANLDRFGRSVLNLSQSLAALESCASGSLGDTGAGHGRIEPGVQISSRHFEFLRRVRNRWYDSQIFKNIETSKSGNRYPSERRGVSPEAILETCRSAAEAAEDFDHEVDVRDGEKSPGPRISWTVHWEHLT